MRSSRIGHAILNSHAPEGYTKHLLALFLMLPCISFMKDVKGFGALPGAQVFGGDGWVEIGHPAQGLALGFTRKRKPAIIVKSKH